MTAHSCIYCHSSDDCRSELIDCNFGIHHCDLHRNNAVRDCRAYLHDAKHVKMSDAAKNPVIRRFLDALQKLEPFHVKRTSGEIQEGWVLRKSPNYFYEFIIFVDTIVTIPVVLQDEIFRRINIDDLLDETIMGFPPSEEFKKIVDDSKKVILDGVYKKEYEEHIYMLQNTISKKVEDESFINQGVCNGRLVRTLILPPS